MDLQQFNTNLLVNFLLV